MVAGTIHSEVTEVYTVLEGSATLVTGGHLIHPQPREDTALRRRVSEPGWTGNGMEGGVTRRIAEGDPQPSVRFSVHSLAATSTTAYHRN